MATKIKYFISILFITFALSACSTTSNTISKTPYGASFKETNRYARN